MGARPSSFKKGGGGFLNNVDGVITGYEFTDEFNGNAYDPTPVKGKVPFHSLNCVLSARVDGADEDVTTTLFVGGFDDFVISDEGHTLTSDEGRELGANTAFATLISSLVEAGFPETNLPEDVINFESIIGTRVRFMQRVNVEATKKLGKRKGKDGKERDRQDLVIDQVYSLPGSAAAAPAKAAAKAPAKAAAGKKAVVAQAADTDTLAANTVTDIVTSLVTDDNPTGSITKAKLGMKVIAKLMKQPEERTAVGKWVKEDANLASIDGLAYDAATSTISIAA